MLRFGLVAALLCLASALSQIQNLDRPGRIPGEYLVVLKPVSSRVQGQKARYVEEAVARIRQISPKINLLKKFDALVSPILHFQADDLTISQAFNIPYVESIVANVMEKRIEQCNSQNTGELYWGLSRISSRDTPDYSNAVHSYDANGGAGVRIYVLDTGIMTNHEDFTSGRAIWGTNTIGGTDGDVHGHGTHCAGTAVGWNSGVAKGATVVAVKVLGDDGFGSTASIVDGCNWVIHDLESHNRGVISMSIGGGIDWAIESAVESAAAANVPCIVAAGNSNGDACNESPAGAYAAITIGATDNTDYLASYSNSGSCVNLLAPGTNILSADISGTNQYSYYSGTSMATPHVAGSAAIFLAQNPTASSTDVRTHLTCQASSGFINLRGVPNTPNLMLYQSC